MTENNIYPEEQARLDASIEKLNQKTEQSKASFGVFLENLNELSLYLSENYHDLDDQEKASVKNTIQNIEQRMHDELGKQAFYEKTKQSPFFGRVDWKEDGEDEEPIFVGIAGIEHKPGVAPLVCDWRAPISSLFYDYEKGEASYLSPVGAIHGQIMKKRQYRIEKQAFVFGIDVNERIADEILKETLARSSSQTMKTIVSTIQKEQNEIIRSNPNQSLLIQGIAGSGKTSIALHRIAYLLYRQKETLKAEDVLVISPSLIFSKYIGNVLPELGEENISQITFESLARDNLKNIALFESREDMIEDLLQNNISRKKEIDFKSSFAFFKQLQAQIKQHFESHFEPHDLVLGETTISKHLLKDLWQNQYKNQTAAIKIAWIADYVTDELRVHNKQKAKMVARVQQVLRRYLTPSNPVEVLKELYQTIGLELRTKSKNLLFYEDVAPLLLVVDAMHGTTKPNGIKCLVVDEMQDHGAIAFYLFQKWFDCPMIVLGDIHQSVEHSFDQEHLQELSQLLNANLIFLNTTYRSTVEIATFAQSLIDLKQAKNFERHGTPVTAVQVSNLEMASLAVAKTFQALHAPKTKTALVCTSISMVEQLRTLLLNHVPTTSLFELEEDHLIVTTSSDCKGMEFDNVIVLGKQPTTMEHRKALHIASTRALHNLVVLLHP